MPTKDPNFWSAILDLLSPEVKSAAMAMIIAALRIIYDRKENQWQRIGLEALLCGAISYMVASGVSFFYTEDSDLAVFCGGAIGLLGVEFVRARARRYISNKADKSNEPG